MRSFGSVSLATGNVLRMKEWRAACAASTFATISASMGGGAFDRLCARTDTPALLASVRGNGTPELHAFQA